MSKPKDEPPAKKKKGESETTVCLSQHDYCVFIMKFSYSVTKVFNDISLGTTHNLFYAATLNSLENET